MFVDQVEVFARAGHGGRGCVAFHREAYVPKGGPSGGNGGRGGDVILEADHDLNNLIAQFYVPRLIAKNGEHGMGKGMDGKFGADCVVKVPCGTLVWRLKDPKPGAAPAEDDSAQGADASDDEATERLVRSADGLAIELDLEDEPEQAVESETPQRELVADLTEHGQRLVLCKGGRGGLGNRNFATARRQTPRFAQPGEPGEEGRFALELRLVANVGLVGYPNAGKSTLLSAISKARPKIAAYPFTTLHPQVGVLEYPDFQRLVVCDVPGLIEGAHRNVGLGHAFLRHIKRCAVLVVVLDMAGVDGRRPSDDYRQIVEELTLYDPELARKPRLVAANKMDEAAAAENLRELRSQYPEMQVLSIAAAFDLGLDEFKTAIRSAALASADGSSDGEPTG